MKELQNYEANTQIQIQGKLQRMGSGSCHFPAPRWRTFIPYVLGIQLIDLLATTHESLSVLIFFLRNEKKKWECSLNRLDIKVRLGRAQDQLLFFPKFHENKTIGSSSNSWRPDNETNFDQLLLFNGGIHGQ